MNNFEGGGGWQQQLKEIITHYLPRSFAKTQKAMRKHVSEGGYRYETAHSMLRFVHDVEDRPCLLQQS